MSDGPTVTTQSDGVTGAAAVPIPADEGRPTPTPTGGSVGVVFVHGIGSQQRSATLTSWGEPIVATIGHWLRDSNAAGSPSVKISRASLTDGEYSEVTVAVPKHTRKCGSPERNATTIYMTEAWWSEAFLPQSSTAVLRWGFKIGLKAVARPITHVSRLARYGFSGQKEYWANLRSVKPPKRWQKPLWTVAQFLYCAGFLFVLIPCAFGVAALSIPLLGVALVATLIGAVVVLGGARVPGIGKYVDGVARALVASVGDASVWTTQPIAAAAMRANVETAIARARKSSEKVIVIAHSQGAAICADLLFGDLPPDPPPANPTTVATSSGVVALVTVGGATTLLGDRRRNIIGKWAQFAPDTAWVNIWALWDPVPSGPVGKGSGGSDWRRWQACMAGGVRLARSYRGIWFKALPLADEKPADEGGQNKENGPEEWPVYNTAFLPTDHTTYQRNIVEVIDPLCEVIFDVAHSGKLDWSRAYTVESGVETVPEHKKNRIRRLESHIVGVRMTAAARVVAIAAAFVYLPTIIHVLSGASWFPGVTSRVEKAIEKAVDDKVPWPFLKVWFQNWSSFNTLAVLGIYLLWVAVVYVVVVAICKMPLRYFDERNIRDSKLKFLPDLGVRIAGTFLGVLLAATVARLACHPWRSMFEGIGIPLWRWWFVVVFAAVGAVVLLLQILWGVRLHRAPAERHAPVQASFGAHLRQWAQQLRSTRAQPDSRPALRADISAQSPGILTEQT